MRSHLLKYYGEVADKPPVETTSTFINYITDPEKKLVFSRQAPIAPYTSDRDLGFYLLLPDKLESNRPVLIAYTTAITTKKGMIYRVAFFLRGKEIVIVTLEEQAMRSIIGSEDFENRKPDLYIWSQRLNYLQDQHRKETSGNANK